MIGKLIGLERPRIHGGKDPSGKNTTTLFHAVELDLYPLADEHEGRFGLVIILVELRGTTRVSDTQVQSGGVYDNEDDAMVAVRHFLGTETEEA